MVGRDVTVSGPGGDLSGRVVDLGATRSGKMTLEFNAENGQAEQLTFYKKSRTLCTRSGDDPDRYDRTARVVLTLIPATPWRPLAFAATICIGDDRPVLNLEQLRRQMMEVTHMPSR